MIPRLSAQKVQKNFPGDPARRPVPLLHFPAHTDIILPGVKRMKKLLLLINPHAGKGGYRHGLGEALMRFHRAGFSTTVAFTDRRGDAPRIAQAEAERYDRIVCVGGDGTLSETVSGLMAVERRPEIGYIPMGTTNDCAASLGIPRDPVQAAGLAASGTAIPFDVGRFNVDRYFTYVAAFGAFTEVSYQTSQEQKNALGKLAYFLDGVGRLPNLTHRWTRVEYDGKTLEDDFIFGAVTNSRSVAGLIHLKDKGVSLSDGLFEVLLIRTPESVIQTGTIVADILANKFDSEYVALFKTDQVRFTFRDPVPWTLDGEDGGVHQQVECRNIPKAVQIVADPKEDAPAAQT